MTTTRDTHSNPVGCVEAMSIDDVRALLTGESAEVLADRIGDWRDYAKYRQALTAISTLLAAINTLTAERDMVWAMARRLLDSAICDTQAEQDGFRLVAISALDAFALKAGYEGYNMESVPNVKAERDALKARVRELEARRCENCSSSIETSARDSDRLWCACRDTVVYPSDVCGSFTAKEPRA